MRVDRREKGEQIERSGREKEGRKVKDWEGKEEEGEGRNEGGRGREERIGWNGDSCEGGGKEDREK